MRRRFDVLHAPARRKIFRRHVRPPLAVVARDVKRPVIRSGPDHTLLERRLRDRIQSAVKLFAGHVACDRLTARAPGNTPDAQSDRARSVPTSRLCRACDGQTAIRSRAHPDRAATSPSVTRAACDRSDRSRDYHTRIARQSSSLLLTRLQIHHAVLSFARTVNNVRVRQMRHDGTVSQPGPTRQSVVETARRRSMISVVLSCCAP